MGDFSRAVTVDWERRIADPLLREDLRKCFAGDPQERFAEAGRLAKNLRSIAERRAAFAQREKAASRGRLVRRAAVSFAVVAAISFLALFAFKQGWKGGNESSSVKLAVLPLANLSVVANDYFAKEMTDDLSGKLGQISALRITGRRSVTQFSNATNSAPEIARKLNVDAIVQGTLKQERDKVQMSIRLFAASTDRLVWSTSYERDLSDVFALQNEVALALANQLKAPLKPEEKARLAHASRVDPKALDLYYRGRASENTDTSAGNQEQIRLYEGAVQISKDFAPAWAALAGAYQNRHYWFEPQPDKPWKRNAQNAVLTAITLNPNLAEAWVQNGELNWGPGNFDHEEALRLFDRALQLNPSSGEALRMMANIFVHAGLFEEARAKRDEAAALEPLAAGPNGVYALVFQGEYKQSLLLWPKSDGNSFTPAHGSHWAWALFADHQTNAAKAKVEEYLQHSKDDPGELTAMKGVLLAAEGNAEGAIEQLKIAEQKTQTSFGDTHHATYFIACAYARLNKRLEALKWLTQTADTGFPCYPLFRDDPNLNNLRDDAGFMAFLHKQDMEWTRRKADWAKYTPRL